MKSYKDPIRIGHMGIAFSPAGVLCDFWIESSFVQFGRMERFGPRVSDIGV
jgi:hypothetical protein